MGVKLTPAQQAVVDHRGSSLLVSAAAGSGKTKVLVDRLLDMVCDAQDPKNIDEFLVITYTSAAASELRGKIAAAISQRLSEDPDNRHLQRQMSRLYLTQISTVHAYCATLLRTYSNELDLPPDFRVMEPIEAELLQQSSIEKTLNECYAHLGDYPARKHFLNTLALSRDDRAAAGLILKQWEFSRCHVDPDRWLRERIKDFSSATGDTLLETAWGKSLYQSFQRTLQSVLARIETAQRICQGVELLAEKYLPAFASDARLVSELLTQSTWEQLHRLSVEKNPFQPFGRMPRGSGDLPEKTAVSKIRNGYKKEIEKALSLFAFSTEQVLYMMQSTSQSMIGLLELVMEFQKTYAAEKRSRRVLDFGDLEHGAIRLLTQKGTEKPSAIAKRESQRFRQIMVDEYQDTNSVQDLIFRALSREGTNLFMVGDVKQSIYSFRLADPSIFLKKYNTYAHYRSAEKGQPCKILLSENFRSDEEILDGVNSLFRLLMSPEVGGLDYGEQEALRPGCPHPKHKTPALELYCIQVQSQESDEEETGEDPGKEEIEASFVANRIVELLQEEPSIPEGDGLRRIRPGDIAILLRAAKSQAPYYIEALQRVGIRAVSEAGSRLLDTMEVESVASMLQVINNPHLDIPLLSAITSPMFAISNDTLAQIRAKHRQRNLFDALCAEREQFPEVDAFVTVLRELQQQSCVLKLHELYRRLEARLSLRTIYGAMPHGSQRLQNLDAFYDMVAAFGNNGEKSLSQFCTRLEKLKKKDIAAAADPPDDNTVLIQTIHRSKGLEYPVVILPGLSRKFNGEEARQSVVTNRELGPACSYVSEQLRFHCPTPAKQAVLMRNEEEARSEELRVLYVAMTRPKNRLIMTCCGTNMDRQLNTIATDMIAMGPKAAAARVKNPGAWVLMAAMSRLEAGQLLDKLVCRPEAHASDIPWRIEYLEAGGLFPPLDNPFRATESGRALTLPGEEQLKARLGFVYPHEAATRLPSKLTATQLKGRPMDYESAELAVSVEKKVHFRFEKPDFTTAERGLSAQQKGTATHVAMQFLRYESCKTPEGVCSELERLRRERYLSEQQVEAVDPQVLWQFFDSALGREVLSAPKVIREFKFSLFVDGELLDKDAAGEQILLQGVTDCCILDEDGLTVLDYKTDRVKAGQEQDTAQFYAGQMNAYALALSRIFRLPVKRRVLYFFSTGSWVEL